MFNSLRLDSGAKIVHQSHKSKLSTRALHIFSQMANNNNILDSEKKTCSPNATCLTNSLLGGIEELQKQITLKDKHLDQFKMHLQVSHHTKSNSSSSESETDGGLAEPNDESTSKLSDISMDH